LVIIATEVIQAYMTFNKKSTRYYRRLTIEQMGKSSASQIQDEPAFSYDQVAFYQELTEGLHISQIKSGNTMLLDSIVHFLVLQIIIATLQLLPKVQIVLILVVEIIYNARLFHNFDLKKGRQSKNKRRK
jgi:hypothetical protein